MLRMTKRALLRPEGSRAGVSDIDRSRADVPEAGLAGAQAEVRVFKIAALEDVRENADAVETFARHIKAETRGHSGCQ